MPPVRRAERHSTGLRRGDLFLANHLSGTVQEAQLAHPITEIPFDGEARRIPRG